MNHIYDIILKHKISFPSKTLAIFFALGMKQTPKKKNLFNCQGFLFSFVGSIFLSYSLAIKTTILQYYDQCEIKKPCNLSFSLDSQMTAPVFVYYELRNFYQNYDQYMNSKNSDQLSGQILTQDQLSSCSPIITNKDLGGNITSWNNTPLNDSDPANPCGLIAKTFFSGDKKHDQGV